MSLRMLLAKGFTFDQIKAWKQTNPTNKPNHGAQQQTL